MPTPREAAMKVLRAAHIKKGDKLYDIGAGDGRFIHFAEKEFKANAIGFEIDPFVYMLAKFKQLFLRWKGKMIRGNFLKHDISDAKIIICYMLPKTLAKFQPKFEKELKPGTKIVSYAFQVGTLKPKKIIPKSGKINRILIYEMPDKQQTRNTKQRTKITIAKEKTKSPRKKI